MLSDYQEALARLLVDRCCREHNRECFGDLELSAEELDSLRAIDPRALDRVAASLAEKRRAAVINTVPHAARLWPELGERYLEQLAAAPAHVEHLDPCLGPGPSELLRMLPRLRADARIDDGAPAWLGDLLALELARACTRRDRQTRSLRCDYPVHQVLHACDRGWLSVDIDLAPHEYRLDAERLRWREGWREREASP